MLRLPIGTSGLRHLLVIGAHCDDIEIGCAGTVLSLLEGNPKLEIDWVVMSGDDVREREARASAAEILGNGRHRVVVQRFRNGYFPAVAADIKDCFEELKRGLRPDLVLTHHRGDFHQDHRVLGELTWNTFRDHLVLEYEIPKYDGDLGRPNVFVPLTDAIRERKLRAIMKNFVSQQGKPWWSESTFNALMRLRGVECNAPDGYAEAFFGPKISLATGQSML
jgi:LmbE family N-acetylglucosaminyl deacetylase